LRAAFCSALGWATILGFSISDFLTAGVLAMLVARLCSNPELGPVGLDVVSAGAATVTGTIGTDAAAAAVFFRPSRLFCASSRITDIKFVEVISGMSTILPRLVAAELPIFLPGASATFSSIGFFIGFGAHNSTLTSELSTLAFGFVISAGLFLSLGLLLHKMSYISLQFHFPTYLPSNPILI
jgi:hypothetical protein